MGMMALRRLDDINDLIWNAVSAERWKLHLIEDVMKFWDRPEAYMTYDGLFPTYRINSGAALPDNKADWPEECKVAIADRDTVGLV